MSDRCEASARQALESVRAPGEAGAQERAWATVRAAYRERPAPVAARPRRRLAAVPLVAVLLAAVVFSPAGATVTRIINRALSVPHIARVPGLTLPAPGRLLVSNAHGTWIVSGHGSVRSVGPWSQASWSPRGLYVAVASASAVAAVSPNGTVAWRQPARRVSDPSWYVPSGYRVAYRSGAQLREIAGDGRADHLLATRVAPIAPAWRPGHDFQVAYVTSSGAVVVRGGDTGALVWHTGPHPGRPLALSWSPLGTRLVLVTSVGAWLYLPGASPPLSLRLPVRAPVVAAAASPDGRRLAVLRGGTTPQLQLADLTAPTRGPRTLLSGLAVAEPTWSPDSAWLVLSWPGEDQWLFVRTDGRSRIVAESRVADKLGAAGRTAPLHLDGWCCAP